MTREVMTSSVLKVVNWFRVRNFVDMQDDDNAEPLTQMKVMKLLYYAQGIALAAFGKQLFSDPIKAWRYGPVVTAVHGAYMGQRAIVDEQQEPDEAALRDYKELSDDAEASWVLNAVQETYGDMSAAELLKQTHRERPWRQTKQSEVIDPELMREYFASEVLVDD